MPQDRLGSFDFRADEDDSGRVAAEFLEDTAGPADPRCPVCGEPAPVGTRQCDDCAEETDADADLTDCD
jgi:predicted amidophosphoribosyltransferase